MATIQGESKNSIIIPLEWRAGKISNLFCKIFPLRGGLPPYARIESRWLDGEPFMPPEYAMTRNWVICQRIRRALIKAASER
jgi:hypothetical protein